MVRLLKDFAYYEIEGKKFQFRAIVKKMPKEITRSAVASFESPEKTYEAYIKPFVYTLVIPEPLPFELEFKSGQWHADLDEWYRP